MEPIDQLFDSLSSYLPHGDLGRIRHALDYSNAAHQGQSRASGEAYISHPIAVAQQLADMRMDADSIQAALLHDVIEDTATGRHHLEASFGPDVAQLVDGVSKLTQVTFASREQAQAENFRKMLLAMSEDLRVIIIKLSDRLHNMRTLAALTPDKRRRIARETLEIYAPIAQRLGMHTMRLELEELGFKTLYPMRYRVLNEAVKRARGNRKDLLLKIEQTIGQRIEDEGISYRIKSREKHVYSIYQKMLQKHKSFNEVLDVYGFRVIVQSVDHCYRTLGILHNLYKPVPNKFKDYIAIPKANGYQALHTTLFTPIGIPVETQMQTEEMERIAKAGIAAHWLYKSHEENGEHTHQRATEWLQQLLELQHQAGSSEEFLEHVKVDLFPDEVYVFTPSGEIKTLPSGATALDFAYSVHSKLGNRSVAAKIDQRLASLSTSLHSGATVEIITSRLSNPTPHWLNFVTTGRARSAIRHFLKNLNRDRSVELGHRLLSAALEEHKLSLEGLPAERLQRLLDDYNHDTLDDLLEQIGLGNRMAALVVKRVLAEEQAPEPDRNRAQYALRRMLRSVTPNWLRSDAKPFGKPLAIRGTEGMVVSFGKCCRPIPGDPIRGHVSAGRGIVIHVENCPNMKHYMGRDELLEVQWEEGIAGSFPVDLRIEAETRQGVLAVLASVIADEGANISQIHSEDREESAISDITIDVTDRVHLAQVIKRLRALKEVKKITRKRG
ncbi:MAG: RelA/SpoT family protein [Gammaproteobacteria bacterium]|nr:RelA/SpoT family protein [Gammaproteobacteria bacterium]